MTARPQLFCLSEQDAAALMRKLKGDWLCEHAGTFSSAIPSELEGHVLAYWSPPTTEKTSAAPSISRSRPRRIYAISRSLAKTYQNLTDGVCGSGGGGGGGGTYISGARDSSRVVSGVSAGVCIAKRGRRGGGVEEEEEDWDDFVLTAVGSELLALYAVVCV